jgi:hypothetical protein
MTIATCDDSPCTVQMLRTALTENGRCCAPLSADDIAHVLSEKFEASEIRLIIQALDEKLLTHNRYYEATN